jgi:hypothetical protein
MIMNDEFGRMWKEAVVVCFEVHPSIVLGELLTLWEMSVSGRAKIRNLDISNTNPHC